MTKNIPASREVYCDGCGLLCGSGGKSRKCEETIAIDGHVLDMNGDPAAAMKLRLDLCDGCADTINKAINLNLEQLRKK